MTTSVRRKNKVKPEEVFAQHIVLKQQAATIVTRSNALKDTLKKWFQTAPDDVVYTNENGSKFYDFPETVSDGKDDYKGMELRRNVGTKFDEDKAEAILKKKGVYEEALTPVLDQDKIYRLVQEEKITEKDIDKMFVESETFAFWPVKGEVL